MIKESLDYQPKGSMCASCVNIHQNCSHLPFWSFPPLCKGSVDGVVTVKCLAFSNTKSRELTNE